MPYSKSTNYSLNRFELNGRGSSKGGKELLYGKERPEVGGSVVADWQRSVDWRENLHIEDWGETPPSTEL